MRRCVIRGPDSVTRLESLSLTRGRIGTRRSVVCVSPLKLAPMPSVEMRRSTRVFVPKTKESDGVRVLRSGRKLPVESGEAKIKVSVEVKDGLDLIRLIDDSDVATEDLSEETGWRKRVCDKDRETEPMVIDDVRKTESQLENRALPSGFEKDVCLNNNKRFGIVYCRKRKRHGVNKSDSVASNANSDVGGLEESKRFGLCFFQRKRRRTANTSGSVEKRFVNKRFLSLTADSDSSFGRSSGIVADVVNSLLRYSSTAKVGLVELSGFLQSQPISGVFASYGISILLNDLCNQTSGFCKIYGTREHTPLFDLDFSCVPLCFTQLHASMWFRSWRLSSLLLINVDRTEEDDYELNDALQCTSFRTHSSNGSGLASESSNLECSNILNTQSGDLRSAIRTLPYRNGVSTRSSQRRRKRSLLTRRARNPSFLGPVALDSKIRKSVVPYPSSILTNHQIQKQDQKNSSNGDIKYSKSTLLVLGKEIEPVTCSVNLLVVEADRCYRESGASVTVELSPSNEWILAIKIDGSLRCYHRVQKGKEAKPSCTNRYTHAIIWFVDATTGWKLEFADRRDWAIFKELFKVCGDRNKVIPAPANTIPIPGVCEVSVCDISPEAPYSRPQSYIEVNEDELCRALLKSSANYDMCCEDEEWLNKFNSELDTKSDLRVHVTEGVFELIIDRLEKAAFCQPDDFAEEVPAHLCLDLASRDVVEAVYSYWMTKRKQKRGPLLKVFQLNEPKKIPVISKPVSRKKRSMKQRHANLAKGGNLIGRRGKDLTVLQAIAARRIANEEMVAKLKEERAKSALEVALAKRRRVQTLMENADLAVYRATMAIRIADAAAQAAQPDQAAAHFLD
ncbi:hypothetical protein V2J09_013571 [Rumex salicifolius]